mgnify:FL=1
MDPRDVNRINYNNYFVGQNLDFLVRSKMRSESLSTPLKNTPAFYDDQVTSKMSLLGKRGFYDPGYIYGFDNSESNQDMNDNQRNKNDDYTNPITREQYDQLILPKEHYRERLMQNYEMNNNPNYNNNIYQNNNIGNKNYNDKIKEEMYYKEKLMEIEREKEKEKERIEMLKERQTPQKLDNFQLDKIKKNQINYENNINPNNNREEMRNEYQPKYPPYYPKEKENTEMYEQMKYDSGMVRNRDKIPNVDYAQQINEYNYINDITQKNVGDLVLPPTKNQILQGVYLENFNKKNSPK